MNLPKLKKYMPAIAVAPLLLAIGCQQPSITPQAPYASYTLTVNTSNPTSGVPITVSYADLSGATSGTASFTRSYNAGTSVVLTAPTTAGINLFSSWTGCTSVSTVNCTVTVSANTTVTANYVAPPNYTLTVASTNPTSGVAISVSPSDNNAATNGTTSFTRSYVTGTAVTLTAPTTSGNNNFTSWTGCTTVSGAVCNVTLTSSRTVTANYVTPIAYGLKVNSTNPSSGVAVTASPADNNGNTSLSSGSTLSYNAGTKVTLTAPAASGSQIFQAWSGCSTASALTCTVTLTAATTVSANYYVAPVGNTYYVGPGGSDSNNGTSLTTPFLTLQKAANTTAPGDVVYALTGNYTPASGAYALVSIRTAGTAAAPIAYRAYPGNVPTLNFASFQGIGFSSDAAYIEINGFTVNGNNQNVTYAQASTPDAIANPGNYPQFNTSCITADARTSTGNHPHHLTIINNIVSNCAGGIGFAGSDYITIANNTVFNCAWYGASGSSAVSVLASYNQDSSTGYKNFITGNKIYNNYELIPFHITSPLKITDGEGIIIDTNMNSAASGSGITYGAYTGRTLITNNVIYGNGSSAILVFQSSHVDIVNNSTYGNVHTPAATSYATPTGRGELAFGTASDVNAYNNILYSYSAQNPFVQSVCASCTVDYNIYYNGVNVGTVGNGPNDLYADPLYVNSAVQDLTKVDLTLNVGSPGIDSGTSNLAPATDFLGNLRPQGKGYDRGAFER